MIEQCSKKDIEDVMNLPDVKERVEIYNKQNKIFKEMLLEHSRIENNIIITDLRGVSPIYTGNRFLIYSLFPEQNISMWIVDVPVNDKCSIAVGHSIINRSANFNVGSNLLKYGGGGHFQVGTCQISTDDTDKVIAELINKMKEETIDKHNL
jgi:nanoRNase/pAp phosphatase (c-di-AMP/oligoRNAs hydrolase)